MDSNNINWKMVFWLTILALLAIAATGLTGWALNTIPDGRFTPEIALTILLLSGVVAFVAVLVITVTVFAALGLSNSARAFGMPEGTIRAVIALSLILIFAITSVFLYGQLRTSPNSIIIGLTQAQLGEIPAEEILSSRPSDAGANLYDVRRRLEANAASEDFAKQMLTIISTLVVAVAGFYFGTTTVQAERASAVPSLPFIRSLKPSHGMQGEEKDVEILGKNFESPKTVKLVLGSSEMTLNSIMSSATKIVGKLAIPKSQPTGIYELILANKDGGGDRLEDAFEVK